MSRLPIRPCAGAALLHALTIASALWASCTSASAQLINAPLQSYAGTNLTQANAYFPDFRVTLSGLPGGTRDAYVQSPHGITNTSNLAFNAYSASSSTINFSFLKPVVAFRAYTVSLYNAPAKAATYTVTLRDGAKKTTPVPAGTNGGLELVITAQASNPISKVELSSGASANYVFNVSALQYEIASTGGASPPPPTPSAAAGAFAQLSGAPALSNVSIGSSNSYGGLAAGQVTAWNGSSWAPVGGALSQISIGSDGTRWGVTSTGAIYRFGGASWTVVPGTLKQISVGNAANVWGVNAAGAIYKWNGTGWTQMPGTYASVSAGSDGTVFALQANDSIWRWNGSGWTQIGGALRWISAGSTSNVWGVNAAGYVYKLNSSTSGWEMPTVPAGTFVGVGAAADGATLLVRNDGTLWKK